jgi:prepilin-type N-terminal cleavage/methylation domain-containing protein
MNKKNTQNQGYTLVELIVTIAVLAVGVVGLALVASLIYFLFAAGSYLLGA